MREITANMLPVAEPPAEGAPSGNEGGASPRTAAEEVIVVSHEDLFNEAPAEVCDACGELLGAEVDGATGYGIPGRGVYLWARGEETRLETVPLCASCASAIGMTALARWEIEEEEG
jgi:hypothetical protein